MGNSETTMRKRTTPRKKKRRDKCIPLFHDERILRKKLIEAKDSFKTDYNWTMCYENAFKNALDSAKEHFFHTEEFRKVMGFSKAAILLITRLFYKEMKHRKYRLTIGEKLLAIAMLKQNPKAYRLLRTVFKIPTPETLVKLLRNPTIPTAVHNNNIMKKLKKKAQCEPTPKTLIKLLGNPTIQTAVSNNKTIKQLKKKVQCELIGDRLCSLLFGQTKLKTKPTHKKVKSSLADYVQIFMIKGFNSEYKQTVACTLSHGPKTGPELAKEIKTIIFKLRKVGYKVLATICDHSYHNRSAIKHLKEESKRIYQFNNKEVKRNVFLVNPQEVIPIFDPPQLLLGLRNQFVTKDIVFTKDGKKGTAKWEHILLLKEEKFIKERNVLHKISKKHFAPKVDKVSYVSQVLSQRVASYMAALSGTLGGTKTSKMPAESRESADLIIFLNQLFDSLNGNKKESDYNEYNKLLREVKYNSPHHKQWKEAIEIFKSMSFVKNGKVPVPEIKCWIETLTGVELLYWKLYGKYGVKSLWMRRVNMDPLTNFLKAVRGDES